MAQRYKKSHPSICPQVDLFSLPNTDTSVEESMYIEVKPSSSIENNGKISFRIIGTPNYYLDAQDSFLWVSFKLVNLDDSDFTSGEDVSVCNGFLHSMFADVDVSIQNQSITKRPTNNCYPYKAYFETLFRFAHQNKSDLEGSLFHLDTDEFKLADTNLGYKNRKEYCAGSELKELTGKLFFDLTDQNRFILNNTTMSISLTRSKDEFCILAPKHGAAAAPVSGKLKISDASFFIRRHNVYPSVSISHQKLLEMNHTAMYPTTESSISFFTIPKGNQSFLEDNLFMGQIPSRIIVGMVENAAFIGDYKKNPFKFIHNNLTYISLMVNNMPVPHRALSLDFTKQSYITAFHLLNKCVSKVNGDTGLPFPLSTYVKGNCFFGFDIRPLDLPDTTLYLENTGNCKLDLKFSAGLSEATTVIVYAEFQKVLSIDKLRQLTIQ